MAAVARPHPGVASLHGVSPPSTLTLGVFIDGLLMLGVMLENEILKENRH